MKINVDCYAGYRGEETPHRIIMGSNNIHVKTLLDMWLAPDHRYFKVLGEDDAVYIIRHDPVFHDWELTFFNNIDILS